MKDFIPVINPAKEAYNPDGTASTQLLNVTEGKWGEKRGYVPAEGAGFIGELGKGLGRGLAEAGRQVSNTLGLRGAETSIELFLSKHADWYTESSRKGAMERAANWAGGVLGNYAPMLAAQVGAAAITGGGSAVAQGAAGVAAVASRASKFSKLAGAGMAYLQTYGDNADRINAELPDASPAERLGLSIFTTAAGAAVEVAFGPEASLSKSLATRQILKDVLRTKDMAAIKALGINSLAVTKSFGKQIASSAWQEGVEGVLQEGAMDIPLALLGGKTDTAGVYVKKYMRLFGENAAGGGLIGGFPATLNAINNARARTWASRATTPDEKAAVDGAKVVGGKLVMDEAALQRKQTTQDYFKAFTESLAEKDQPLAGLIENLAYKWAYAAREQGDVNFKPETMIAGLRTALLQNSAHSDKLLAIVDEGQKAGVGDGEIIRRQLEYIRTNMEDASNLLNDLEEKVELVRAKRDLEAFNADIGKTAPQLTKEESDAVSKRLSDNMAVPLEDGRVISPGLVARLFEDDTETLKRLYVHGEIGGIVVNGRAALLRINDDLSATVVFGKEATTFRQPVDVSGLRTPEDIVMGRGERAPNSMAGDVTQRRGDALDGLNFSSTKELVKTRAALVRMWHKQSRAENFAIRLALAGARPVEEVDLGAARKRAMDMGYPKSYVDQLSPAELLSVTKKGIETAEGKVERAAPTLDEFIAERSRASIEAEQKAEEDLKIAERNAKADEAAAGSLERAKAKLEELKNRRALESRNAMAEFYARYPGYADEAFQEQRREAIRSAAAAVEDGELRTRLNQMLAADGVAEVAPERKSEEQAQREYKTLSDAMAALEASDPGLAERLAAMRQAEADRRVAMALRTMPDEPQLLMQGINAHYIAPVRLAIFYSTSNPSAVVEEIMHHMIENHLLPNAAMAALEAAFATKGPNGETKRDLAFKENAAKAFLAYVRDGKVPKGNKGLIPAFLLLRGAIAGHLDAVQSMVMSADGKTSIYTGEQLKIPEKLRALFASGLDARKQDEDSKIYATALTDSMLAGDYGLDAEPDGAVNKAAERAAKVSDGATPASVIDSALRLHPDLFDRKTKLGQLDAREKFMLANMLDDYAGWDDIVPGRLFPKGYKSREDAIVDEAMHGQGLLFNRRATPEQDARFRELTKTWTPGGDWSAWKAAHPAEYAELEKMREEVLEAQGYNVGPVWHGTSGNAFTVFDRTKGTVATKASFGRWGHFFTGSRTLAEQFTKRKWSSPRSKPRDGARVISAFLRIRNPVRLGYWDFIGMSNKTIDEQDAQANVWKDSGHDGVIISTSPDGRDFTGEFPTPQYVAFDSAQIKSAEVAPDATGRIPPPSEWGDTSSPSLLFNRASKATKDYLSGDPDTRARAKEDLKSMGVSEETLKPKGTMSRQKLIATLKRQWAKAYGLDEEKNGEEVMDAIRAQAGMMFGDRATKVKDGKVVPSIGKESKLTEADLMQLMLDDRVLERDSDEWVEQQKSVAADIDARTVEGYRSPAPRLTDGFFKSIGRSALAVVRYLNARYQNLYTLIQWVAGTDSNNALVKSAVYGAKAAGAVFVSRADAFKASWWKVLSESGYSNLLELADRVDVGEYRLTRSEVLALYIWSNWGENFDTKRIRSFYNSGRLGDAETARATAEAAVKFVREKEPGLHKVAEFMEEVSRQEFEAARATALELGRDVPEGTDDKYLPIAYMDGSLNEGEIGRVLEEAFERDLGRRISETPSELKPLSGGSGVSLNLDAISLFQRHMLTLYHFNANAGWIHDSLSLLKDGYDGGNVVNPIKDAMRRAYGDDVYYTGIVDYIRRAARLSNTLETTKHDIISSTLRYLRGGAGPAFLSMNPWTILMQPISGLHVIGQMGFKHAGGYISNIASIIREAKDAGGISKTDAFALVRKWSPHQADMLKSRQEQELRALEEALKGNPLNAYGARVAGFQFGKWIEKGLIPMQMTDAVFRMAAWKTAFDSKMEELGGDPDLSSERRGELSARYADEVVGYSMNPADPNEIPMGYTEAGEFGKAVQLFSGQPLAEFRGYMMGFIMPMLQSYTMARKAGTPRGASVLKGMSKMFDSNHGRRFLWTIMLPGIAIGWATRRRPPTFKELMFDMLCAGTLMKIPIVGGALWAHAIYGFAFSDSVAEAGPLRQAAKFFDELLSGSATPASMLDAFRTSATIITRMPDFPYRVMTRAIQGMTDDDQKFIGALAKAAGLNRE